MAKIAQSAHAQPQRVSTLELFFDLVFVFTLTELTTVLFDSPDGRGLLRVVVMLGLIWWMYGGYAWMTNAVDIGTTPRRLVLLAAMGAYFVLALSIPHAFGATGLAFAIAYLLVVVLHSALFTQATVTSAVHAILTLAPFNLFAASVVVVGGALGGTPQYLLWTGAFLFEWLQSVVRRPRGFLIAPAHFVERHGLVVIIAIGESVVAIGFGASHLPVDGSLVAVAVVGLALSACLWWLYFGGDDERAEQALGALPEFERATASLRAFGYWHMPMLLGIIAIAAVSREATAHPFETLNWARAAILGGGVAAYLTGEAAFRAELGLGTLRWRAAGALAALIVIPVGARVSPFAEMAVLVAVLIAVIAVDAGSRRVSATMTPAMDALSLDHLVIHVSEWERSNAFYREVLGAQVIERGAGYAYRIGDQQLNCHGPGVDPDPVARVPVAPGNSDLCFVWPGSVEEARRHLRDHGVPVEQGPVPRNGARGAGLSLYFRDPDGSLLELISYEAGEASAGPAS